MNTEVFRCFCRSQPILGMIKMENKKVVFHIKVYKQTRIFAEIFLDSGSMRFRCRECFRIHRVTIVQNKSPEFAVEEESRPDSQIPVA